MFPNILEVKCNVSRISQFSSKNYQFWLEKSIVLPSLENISYYVVGNTSKIFYSVEL